MNKNKFKLLLNEKNDYLSSYLKKDIRTTDRDPKHYAPANKEWKNSVYNYNKSSLWNMVVKDQYAASFIKSHFNLALRPTKTTKSKRMRDFLRHRSVKQLYVSKPEIKQSSDKVIVTVYTHDREKFSHLKKLYMLNKWVNTNIMGVNQMFKESIKSNGYLINKYVTQILIDKKVFNRHRTIKYGASRNIQKKGSRKYSIAYKLLPSTVKSLLIKKQYITALGFNYFLIWILSVFRIQVNVACYHGYRSNETERSDVVNISLTMNEKKGKGNKNKFKQREIVFQKNITIAGVINVEMLNRINTILLDYIIINFRKVLNKPEITIFDLYRIFIKKFNYQLIRKVFREEALLVKCMVKLYISKFKYYNYLPGLKNLLSNIYNKRVQFNLINLKYFHLNSNLHTEALSTKLRDRTKNLYSTLESSFKLKVFKPKNQFLVSEAKKHSIVKNVETYFGRYNVINGDILNILFEKMFNKNKTSVSNIDGNVKNILTSLKYKWITGIRLEAAGRLTRRYSAERALYKYKRRGTLKNLEHLKNIENKLQSPSLFLMRSHVRPNMQHSFATSKRRIGAFGLKIWTSSS